MLHSDGRRLQLPYRAVFVAVLALVALALNFGGDGGHRSPTFASASIALPPGLSIGFDTDPTGNTATSLGAIDNCSAVSLGSTFAVDIFVSNVSSLLSWYGLVNYAGSILNVTGVDAQQFQAAQPGSNVLSLSDPLPSSNGVYAAGAVDTGSGQNDSGTGVLARLTIKAVGAGVSQLWLSGVSLTNISGASIGDTNGDGVYDGPIFNGGIAVNSACSQDSDGDGVADFQDNCPTIANPDQKNTDQALAAAGARMGKPINAVIPPMVGDNLGDACDPDIDNDSVGLPGNGRFYMSNAMEAKIGTDSTLTCPDQGPLGTDPWPPDLNGATGDRWVGSGDLVLLAKVFGTSALGGPPYLARRDLNGDGSIGSGDLVIIAKYFGMGCS